MDSSPPQLLIVEDEEHLSAVLKLNLELEGYEPQVAATLRDAKALLNGDDRFDAIVLDVMLPDGNGFELCKELRNEGNFTPVIMLTARGAAEDRVRGLESGADDYLAKPFELEELLARVRSMLRRRKWERAEDQAPEQASAGQASAGQAGTGQASRGQASPEIRPEPAQATIGEAEIDFEQHEVRVKGELIKLTRLELDLVRYFVQNPGRVLKRDELLEQVWKLRNYSSARTIDNFISRLRRHFEKDPRQPRHFVSVRGAGYRFLP